MAGAGFVAIFQVSARVLFDDPFEVLLASSLARVSNQY
jgi:hypothetical protein